MKKNMVLVAVLAFLPFFAFAHGGEHGHDQSHYSDYNVCYYSTCTQDSVHFHAGVHYTPHHLNDGHAHQICQLENCYDRAIHTHNKILYFPKR